MSVKISGTKAVTSKPTKPSTAGMTTGYFSDSQTAITNVTPYFLNEIIDELQNAIQGAGIGANPADQTQLSQALSTKLPKVGGTITGQITLDMSDSEVRQEPIVSSDWLIYERVIFPSQMNPKGDSTRISDGVTTIFDNYTGWFRGKDFRYVSRSLGGVTRTGPNLTHHDVLLCLGETELVTDTPVCYIPLDSAANKVLREARLYWVSYDDYTARTFDIILQERTLAGVTWSDVSGYSWTKTLGMATTGGITRAQLYEYGYASDSGDYFFNIPAYGSAQLYFEDDFEFESGKLYRFRVAAGEGPASRPYGSPEAYFEWPFNYVGITGFKVEYAQKRIVV